METKELISEYNNMPADVREGDAGEALLRQIATRKAAGKNTGIHIADNGDIKLVDIDAIADIHAQRMNDIRDLKARLKPMPMEVRRVGNNRNLPCPCGSGRKFKKCCFYLDTPVHIIP